MRIREFIITIINYFSYKDLRFNYVREENPYISLKMRMLLKIWALIFHFRNTLFTSRDNPLYDVTYIVTQVFFMQCSIANNFLFPWYRIVISFSSIRIRDKTSSGRGVNATLSGTDMKGFEISYEGTLFSFRSIYQRLSESCKI